MKSILVGNGINIQIGGRDYTNHKIITRLLSNLETNDYSRVFAGKINNEQLKVVLNGIHGELKKILRGEYDIYCSTPDEKQTLERVKKQYTLSSSMFSVGMEDYFFIFLLIHKKYHDSEIIKRATHDGMCFLFLDAIYNNGDIQKLSERLSAVKREKLYNLFSEFDDIFTVNYDCNIEKLSGRKVYHLHGDFNTLYDQYDTNTCIGKAYEKLGEENPVTPDTRHIYCNAIMGFCGPYKEEVMRSFQKSKSALEFVTLKVKTDSSVDENMGKFKYSKDTQERLAYAMYEALRENPNLGYLDYHKEDLEKISGELSIAGLSPNNDDHIWGILRNNSKLAKITYYYKSQEDKETVESLYADMNITTVPVEKLW
ncbi:hypothetical protein [Clostridium scatologenes]|uniref:SIR2-like domain-containing protein n=1 Tax=Clostridium scatologenes TaxID=1548 RepID=A0A0E3JSH4_CLOSL|nr:hypothetical protein [Clostridium scatologenes]AKA72367.1 hypothetical protein CSCA_5242 [Clostridium scatologenes]